MSLPPLISAYQAKPLLDALAKGRTFITSSLDLGVDKVSAVIEEAGVQFEGLDFLVPWDRVREAAADDRKVWILSSEGLQQVQIYSEATGWVRVLCPTKTAPTVLVSGTPMHRIKDTDPVADTKAKMKAIGVVRGRVLDTATGLGYTAIQAARTASEVVTIELDPSAIEVCRLNPWSQELFTRSNIRQIAGDAFEEVSELPAGAFAAVIHDPPTLSLGGELYSEEFYRKLKRVLARKGKLFHYIGDPTSGLGKRHYPGIMNRLHSAGFTRIERHPEAYGLTAEA